MGKERASPWANSWSAKDSVLRMPSRQACSTMVGSQTTHEQEEKGGLWESKAGQTPLIAMFDWERKRGLPRPGVIVPHSR